MASILKPVKSAQARADEQSALTRYVRKRRVLNKQFVEFDFAIGDPSLYVELVLPLAAFEQFCERNQVVMMSEQQARAVDRDMAKWRYGEEDDS